LPYVVPRGFPTSNESALVLAFGHLSVLEACSLLREDVVAVNTPCDRVATVSTHDGGISPLTKLAGIHKIAGPLVKLDEHGIRHIAEAVLNNTEFSLFSVSSYCVDTQNYEDSVQLILHAFRSIGLRKIRLLRPHGHELHAERVLSRGVLDLVLFEQNGSLMLAPTVFVPEPGVANRVGPQQRVDSSVSLSPRLARTLVNIAALSPGKTLLDPFCGSGTILVEAALQGLNCVGVDVSRKRIAQTRENLSLIASGHRALSVTLKVGDSRELPRLIQGHPVDAIVTEPILLPTLEGRPSLPSAKSMAKRASIVYSQALEAMARVLVRHGLLIIVVPVLRTTSGAEVTIALDAAPLGLRPYQPGQFRFEYPIRLPFESTRWVKRAVYVYEAD
jgi:SAM-dependent methyltransferase